MSLFTLTVGCILCVMQPTPTKETPMPVTKTTAYDINQVAECEVAVIIHNSNNTNKATVTECLQNSGK